MSGLALTLFEMVFLTKYLEIRSIVATAKGERNFVINLVRLIDVSAYGACETASNQNPAT